MPRTRSEKSMGAQGRGKILRRIVTYIVILHKSRRKSTMLTTRSIKRAFCKPWTNRLQWRQLNLFNTNRYPTYSNRPQCCVLRGGCGHNAFQLSYMLSCLNHSYRISSHGCPTVEAGKFSSPESLRHPFCQCSSKAITTIHSTV